MVHNRRVFFYVIEVRNVYNRKSFFFSKCFLLGFSVRNRLHLISDECKISFIPILLPESFVFTTLVLEIHKQDQKSS